MRKVFQFFLTRCEKCFTFFLQMRKVFHFFRQNPKIDSIFLTSYGKCFTFFDKMQKVFHFFPTDAKIVSFFFDNMRKMFQFFLHLRVFCVKMRKLSGIFHLCTIFLVFFYNMCAKINQVS